MTFRLITLDELKRNLGYDGITDQDERLTELAEDASELVINYIGDSNPSCYAGWASTSGIPLVDTNGDPELDTNGESVVPRAVRRATLLVAGALDKDREGQTDPITEAVKSILYSGFRTPVVS